MCAFVSNKSRSAFVASVPFDMWASWIFLICVEVTFSCRRKNTKLLFIRPPVNVKAYLCIIMSAFNPINLTSYFSFPDLLPAIDGDTKTMTFLQEVVDILLAYIVESFDRETKVIDFHYPNELLQLNNWELQDEPASLDDILISCRATLKYAIKTGRPQNKCSQSQ